MKKFFQSLRDLIMTVDGVVHCRMWNNQLQRVMDGKMELFDMPAVFIEFVTTDINNSSMGGGIQIFNPLIFKLHILHKQLDAGDGTFEQNLDVYDMKDKIFQKVYKFQPGISDETNKVGSCIRITEEQDYQHHFVYHYIQTYQTTLVDDQMQEPVNGIDWDPVPMPLELDVNKAETVEVALPYDETIQYLAADMKTVIYNNYYWIIFSDTPNPAGAFDTSKWLQQTSVNNFTPAP